MAVPEVPESLQCLACAVRQETGSVNETVLENYNLFFYDFWNKMITMDIRHTTFILL